MTNDTHTTCTDDRRHQTAEHDVAKGLERGTGDKRGESADSIRPHLERGRRGPPSEGRQS
ncbi:hypothetical protein ACPWT1_07185 [Ramlibacter sp. MMS24-I3-19]|uniref:hypothetical protein n=1 Tax=Ramlibacter sp. MMS24-I3-19 TaxID=3416606 RepID=UPI003CFE14E7